MKTVLFCSVFKKIPVHTNRFRIVFARPHYNAYPYWKRCQTSYSLIISLSILLPLLSSRQIKSCPTTLKLWSLSWSFPEPSGFWRASTKSFLSSSFRCPKKIRSFMIFCYLLEKSKSCLNRVKRASKSVKRLKITAINKETNWKRLSAIL